MISANRLAIRRRPTEREPSHSKLTDVIDELHMQENEPEYIMATFVDAVEVHDRIEAGCEGSIQPSAPLTKKLWGCCVACISLDGLKLRVEHLTFRNVCLSLRGLHITERPFVSRFCNELEAQDTVLSKKHVFFKDIHAFYPLFTKFL